MSVLRWIRKYGFEMACTIRHHPMTNPSHRHQAPHGLNSWHSVVYTYIGGFNLLLAGDIPCVKGEATCYVLQITLNLPRDNSTVYSRARQFHGIEM